MINKFLFWVSGRLPVRIISDGEAPYLERYYLFSLLGWTFYLHRFVGSDPDRGLHDHPWARAFSIVLSGWYWEERRSGTKKVRWFNSLTGDTFHRVVLPCPLDGRPFDSVMCGGPHHEPQACWTLFFHRSGRAKTWGFLSPIEGEDGAAVFAPYRYTREGSQAQWWKTAPKGRNIGRTAE